MKSNDFSTGGETQSTAAAATMPGPVPEAHGYWRLEFTRPDGMKLTTVLSGSSATDNAQWPPGPLGVRSHFRFGPPHREMTDTERQILVLCAAQADRIDKELKLSEEHLSEALN